MAFLLVVIVSGEVVSDDRMLFKSIYRCNEFAAAIEERLERGSSRMARLEGLIWTMYPFILASIYLSKDL